MIPPGVVLRRILADRALTGVTVLVLVVLASSAAVVPGQARASLDADLREGVRNAADLGRSIEVTRPHPINSNSFDDTAADLKAGGSAIAEQLPPMIQTVVNQPDESASSVRLSAPTIGSLTRRVALRIDPGFDDQVVAVSGRMPRADAPEGVVEVALSTSTADLLKLTVAEEVPLVPDPTDPYAARYGPPLGPYMDQPLLRLRVTGLFEAEGPAAGLGEGRGRLLDPLVKYSADYSRVTVTAAGLVATQAYSHLQRALGSGVLLQTWRFPVDPARLDAAAVTPLSDALAVLAQQFTDSAFVPVGQRSARTTLDLVLTEARTGRAAAAALVASVVSSIVVVALTLLAALGLTRADARRLELNLLRARGASASALVIADIFEAVVVALPAVVVGSVVAASSGSGRSGLGAAAGVALLGAAVMLLARRAGAATGPRGAGQRTVAQIGVAVLAAAAAAALFRDSQDAEVNSLAATAPVLLAFACAVLLGRVVPPLIRVISPLAGRTRGVVAGVSLRAVARRPGVGVGVIAVLVATATATQLASIAEAGSREPYQAALRQVGADVVVDGTQDAAAVATAAGATATATARMVTVNLVDGGVQQGELVVLALDLTAYAAVVAGGPLASAVPQLDGSAAGDVQAMTSGGQVGGIGLNPGSVVTIDGVDVVVRQARGSFPSLPDDVAFMVVPLQAWTTAGGTLGLARTYLRSDQPDRLADDIAATDPDLAVSTRTEVQRQLAGRPIARALGVAVRAGVALSVLLAALAVVTTAARAVKGRRGEMMPLVAIGATPAEVIVILAVELVVGVVIGASAGLVVGLATTQLMAAGIDLHILTGTDNVVVRATPFVGVAVGCLLAILAAVAASAVSRRQRRDLTTALRSEQR